MSNQYGNVNFLEVLKHQESQMKKAKELRQQMQEELAQIEAKYQYRKIKKSL